MQLLQVLDLARDLAAGGCTPLGMFRETLNRAADTGANTPSLRKIQYLQKNEKRRRLKESGGATISAADVLGRLNDQRGDSDETVRVAVEAGQRDSAKKSDLLLIGSDTAEDGNGERHVVFTFSSVLLGEAAVRCAKLEGSLYVIIDGKHSFANNKWLLLVISIPIRNFDGTENRTSCQPLAFSLIKTESTGAVDEAVRSLHGFCSRMVPYVPSADLRSIRTSLVVADGAHAIHNGAALAASAGGGEAPVDARDSAHVLRKATHSGHTGYHKLVDKENLPHIARDVSMLRESTTQEMFDTLLRLFLRDWRLSLGEAAYADYFNSQYGNGNWARFATGVPALDACSQTLESFNLTIARLCGPNSGIDGIVQKCLPSLLRLSGQRFVEFENSGAFRRASLLQTGIIPSEVLEVARDLTEGKADPACRLFCCLRDGREISVEELCEDLGVLSSHPSRSSIIFNRNSMSRKKNFVARHNLQHKLEFGEALPKSVTNKDPSEFIGEYHTLSRVSFTAKNGCTMASCTCLEFAQRGVCPHSAAALHIAGEIDIVALGESMLPVQTGRNARIARPSQLRRGVCDAIGSMSSSDLPSERYCAKVGLGALSGSKKVATGPSGRSQIGVRVAKVFSGTVFLGKVFGCQKLGDELFWHVRYDDGDVEDLNENDLTQGQALHLALSNAGPPRDLLPATKLLRGAVVDVRVHGGHVGNVYESSNDDEDGGGADGNDPRGSGGGLDHVEDRADDFADNDNSTDNEGEKGASVEWEFVAEDEEEGGKAGLKRNVGGVARPPPMNNKMKRLAAVGDSSDYDDLDLSRQGTGGGTDGSDGSDSDVVFVPWDDDATKVPKGTQLECGDYDSSLSDEDGPCASVVVVGEGDGSAEEFEGARVLRALCDFTISPSRQPPRGGYGTDDLAVNETPPQAVLRYEGEEDNFRLQLIHESDERTRSVIEQSRAENAIELARACDQVDEESIVDVGIAEMKGKRTRINGDGEICHTSNLL